MDVSQQILEHAMADVGGGIDSEVAGGGEAARELELLGEAVRRSRSLVASSRLASPNCPRSKCRSTYKTFYQIADSYGRVLGETFERAVAQLKRELTSKDSLNN